MSDLFDRLIERAHGGSSEIRPRPASVFETDGGIPAIDSPTVEAVDASHSPRQIDGAAPSPMASGRRPDPAPRAFGPSPRSLARTGDDAASPHSGDEGSVDRLRPVRLMPPVDAPASGLAAFHEDASPASHRESPSPPEPGLVEQLHPSPTLPAPQLAAPVRTPSRRERDIDAESNDRAVTISIGRIDIQAIPPAPSTPPPRRFAPPRHLTLEDYVRQRNEGVR